MLFVGEMTSQSDSTPAVVGAVVAVLVIIAVIVVIIVVVLFKRRRRRRFAKNGRFILGLFLWDHRLTRMNITIQS